MFLISQTFENGRYIRIYDSGDVENRIAEIEAQPVSRVKPDAAATLLEKRKWLDQSKTYVKQLKSVHQIGLDHINHSLTQYDIYVRDFEAKNRGSDWDMRDPPCQLTPEAVSRLDNLPKIIKQIEKERTVCRREIAAEQQKDRPTPPKLTTALYSMTPAQIRLELERRR